MSDLNVTVAVTTPFTPLFELDGRMPMPGDRWDDLPKAHIAARREENLRTILSRAARETGVRLTEDAREAHRRSADHDGRPAPSEDPADHLVWVAFRRDDDDEVVDASYDPPIRRRDTRLRDSTVVVRDEAGQAVWRRPPFEATLEELLDAGDAGLLEGDPLQPYLIPSVPQGDIGLSTWEALVIAVAAGRGLLGLVADIEGAAAFRERLKELRRRRSAPASEVIERRAGSWRERGAAPSDLVRLLRQQPRTTAEVSALLGCAREEADALLWGIGFSYDDARAVWMYEGDEAAKLIAGDIYLHGYFAVGDVGEDDQQALLRQRTQAFLKLGHVPDAEAWVQEHQRKSAKELMDGLSTNRGRRGSIRRRLRGWRDTGPSD